MNHRLLLSSTALVGAGILFAGAAPAQAQAPIKVTLGGYTEFGAAGATDDTLDSAPDRGYTFYMDNEVHITAEGTSDSGITYGSYLEMEIGSGSAPGSQAGGGNSFASGSSGGNVYVDEVNLFFNGNFGRVELGRQDGAEDVMFVGGEDAQAGTGGVDGDTSNLATAINIENTGDATKATYFTPRVGGFQLGASYIPDSQDNGGKDGAGFDNGFKNVVGAGGNWVGAFGGVDLTLSAVGVIGDGEANGADDTRDYSVGGLIAVGGLSFGATWGQLTDAAQAKFVNLGLKYGFGNANASIGYSWNDIDALDDIENIFVASGDVGLMPGVTLKADVSYNTKDPGKNDSAGADQGGTLAGVMSIQMDY
jgi:outer membrane protein OmpU